MNIEATKIIKVIVKEDSSRYAVSQPIYKEDYGLYLLIEGLELPEIYTVDFSASETASSSVSMLGNSDGVLIPQQFIKTGQNIFAFLYLTGNEFGRTVYKFKIPNRIRPDRTNEEPEPEEQSIIDQAITALNNAVEQTAEDVQTTSINAERAFNSAESAEQARDDAYDYANNAQSSAESASESARVATEKATASAESASEAEQAKDTAETYMTAAHSYAEQADASATASVNSAEQAESARDTAQGYATQAQTSANSAQTSASQASASASASAQSASASAQIKADVEGMVDDAQASASASAQSATASANSASQASGYAQSASASAQSASDYASQAQTSAQTATAKASEASTSASTASTKASESAQSASQALSYKTDAESAKTASQTAQGLTESARDTAVSAKTDAESARDDAVQAKEDAESAVASISGALDDKAPVITDTASGAIASFTDGADDLPLKSLVIDINPVQDLSHGDPSPENICPISGWTQVDVEQSGVNVWDEEWEVGGIKTADGTLINEQRIRSKNLIPCVPNTTYYILDPTNGDNIRVFYYAKNGSYIGCTSFIMGAQTTPNNARFMRFIVATTYGTTYNHDISINYPSTDHDYHPYTGRSITIDLGQTVYGGKLDVLSGVMRVDMAMVDLGTLNWAPNSERFYSLLSPVAKPSGNYNVPVNAVCSAYKNLSQNAVYAKNIGIAIQSLAGTSLHVYDPKYTDASAFKSAMNGVQLCYELATPIEIQLSANQINSLYGVNNIWADSGDVEVEYRADTKLYIERLTAPDSADMVADANITSGQYFMVGNSLYKATANIANGSAIVVGTNCIRKSLSEALNEINA